MSLTTLKKLVPPPTKINTGTLKTWQKVERSLGLKLPRDYREFIFSYGGGLFADFYLVFDPFSTDQYLNLASRIQMNCQKLRELCESNGPDYIPYPIYPEKGGLLPWGNDENGNEYYWLTEGPPTKWKVVQDNVRGDGFYCHPFGMVEFLTKIQQRKIPALASGYPPIIMRCPIETCAGWVEGADDVSWYCETCSYEWDTREELNEAIEEVIANRPYRAKCYVKRGKNFDPAPPRKEPADYAALVEREIDD